MNAVFTEKLNAETSLPILPRIDDGSYGRICRRSYYKEGYSSITLTTLFALAALLVSAHDGNRPSIALLVSAFNDSILPHQESFQHY